MEKEIVPPTEQDEYTIILLATPVREQVERKNRMYELYSAIAPQQNNPYFDKDH